MSIVFTLVYARSLSREVCFQVNHIMFIIVMIRSRDIVSYIICMFYFIFRIIIIININKFITFNKSSREVCFQGCGCFAMPILYYTILYIIIIYYYMYILYYSSATTHYLHIYIYIYTHIHILYYSSAATHYLRCLFPAWPPPRFFRNQ